MKLGELCRLGAMVSIAAFVGGCANAPLSKNVVDKINADSETFIADKAHALQPYYRALYVEGEHNAVLNFMYLGLAAMERGYYEDAERAFDGAIQRIEAIYGEDPHAKMAKSLWNEEKVKDFKGEPYERAMAYYYRGILYLRRGDYQNARAMFLSGEQQDTMSEHEEFQGDFGLLLYLASWASYCDGDEVRAGELKRRADESQEFFSKLSFEKSHLILIDAGLGPVKNSAGKYGELLEIVPRPVTASAIDVEEDHIELDGPVILGADIDFQATSRGGRPIQSILDGKAQFKGTTETIGDAAMAVGSMTMMSSAYSNDMDMYGAGALVGAFGLLSSALSQATSAAADTRVWMSVPKAVYLASGRLKAGSGVSEINYAYQNEIDLAVDDSRDATLINAIYGRCGVSWGKTHSEEMTRFMVDNPTPVNRKVLRAASGGGDGQSSRSSSRSTTAYPDDEFRDYLAMNFGDGSRAPNEISDAGTSQ